MNFNFHVTHFFLLWLAYLVLYGTTVFHSNHHIQITTCLVTALTGKTRFQWVLSFVELSEHLSNVQWILSQRMQDECSANGQQLFATHVWRTLRKCSLHWPTWGLIWLLHDKCLESIRWKFPISAMYRSSYLGLLLHTKKCIHTHWALIYFKLFVIRLYTF